MKSLIHGEPMKLWALLLAIWMLLWGLLSISNFQFEASKVIMGILAIAVAIFIVVQERTHISGS